MNKNRFICKIVENINMKKIFSFYTCIEIINNNSK